jgi:sporulation protein YlmC with PRC-barrel domain
MRSINTGLLALGLFIVPFGAAAQTPGDEARASVEDLSGAGEIHSQTRMPPLTQTAQNSGTTTAGSAETAISVKSLLDAKVLDSTNREMGTIKSLLADPQSGKLVRADIALKGGGVLGKGSDQQISVPWEQLSVKRQEGNFVLVLNQEAMQKIQSIQKQETSERQQKK